MSRRKMILILAVSVLGSVGTAVVLPSEARAQQSSVTIGSPEPNTNYSLGSNIAVAGGSANVAKVRVRIKNGDQVKQEGIVNAGSGGSWNITLSPPAPNNVWADAYTQLTIEAQGLNIDGEEVGVAATRTITVGQQQGGGGGGG